LFSIQKPSQYHGGTATGPWIFVLIVRIDLLQPGPTTELGLDPTLWSGASSFSRLVGPRRTAQHKEEMGSGGMRNEVHW
jgi:hypothetical protein